jgi:hypothetical protein
MRTVGVPVALVACPREVFPHSGRIHPMKKIIISLFAASTLLVGAPLPAIAGADIAAACDGDVPDAWKRPGGFCDQNDYNNSISTPSDPGCVPVVLIGMNARDNDIRTLVADRPDTCCTTPVKFKFVPHAGAVIVAVSDPCRYD